MNDNGDPLSDQALAKTALGVLAGAAAPAAILSPRFRGTALGLRREGMLSGLATLKNVGTGVGAMAMTAPLEGTSTIGRTAPIKELFRVPTNARNFLDATKTSYPHQQKYSHPINSRFAPSRVIGALDTMFTKALQRSGVPMEEIQKLLLTKDRSLLSGWKLTPEAKALADQIIPFQRVPANVVSEGIEKAAELGQHWSGPNKKLASKALTVAAPAAGYAAGTQAKTPQEKMLASLLLTLAGPRTALMAGGMAIPAGRSAAAGISPIPDWAFDPKTMTGYPPAIMTVLRKMGIIGDDK